MKFKFEPWSLTEKEYCKDSLKTNSTLFFLGNGYFGLKGSFEEDTNNNISSKGAYINAFYETKPIVYGEKAFGFPSENQAILDLPDPTEISIYLDDELFCCDRGKIISYSRSLLLKEGVLKRSIVWESPKGRKAKIEFYRCVSMVRKHLAIISCKITEVENTKKIKIISSCSLDVKEGVSNHGDPRKSSGFEHNPLICKECEIESNKAVIIQDTINSGLTFAQCVSHSSTKNIILKNSKKINGKIIFNFESENINDKNQVYNLDKFISYYTSIESVREKLKLEAIQEIGSAELAGATELFKEHSCKIKDFWDIANIEIEGDNTVQAVRFNIFSIYQSAGTDGYRNIAAKGLSGKGYEGHYFWDTEIYIIPFFSYTFPEIASKLLQYRFNTLEKAKERAVQMNENGAMYPWRTINGEESSAFFPAGTAQYHINADISYGIYKYFNITGDVDFLKKYGLEILIETARLWMSIGFFDYEKKEFRINGVTGPDEYTAIVNNNFYTNIMARFNLNKAIEAINLIKKEDSEYFKSLSTKLDFSKEELVLWEEAAKMMKLPYDKKLCVDAQDDSFLSKEKWDFFNNDLNKYPLLLNLHPLVIYRYQILKQPDVVLANFLLGNEFSKIRKMRDYDYYNSITTGDSSLAPCVQSIMAAELGKTEEAYDYFMRTVRMDIDNINSNVGDGIHIAAMGGTWMSLIYGFAGLRDYAGELSFFPRLPANWTKVAFNLCYLNNVISIEYNNTKAIYSLSELSKSNISFKHIGEEITLEPGQKKEVSIKPCLKAVIFDLDGVITDTSELHYQAWNKLAKEEGYIFSREINEQLRGVSRIASLEIILKSSGANITEQEKIELASRKNDYYKEMLLSLGPNNILPGVREFIDSLKSNGIKTALASASRNAPTVLQRLGITEDFDVIMDAGKVEKGKPDPEIFVSAAEKLGFYVEQCVGVEDAEAGVIAIKGGGLFSVGIGSAAKDADFCIENTEGLNLEKIKDSFYKNQ